MATLASLNGGLPKNVSWQVRMSRKIDAAGDAGGAFHHAGPEGRVAGWTG